MTLTRQDIETRLGATTNDKELWAETMKIASETGIRLPTRADIIRGYSAMFKAAGMSKDECIILTIAAAQATTALMEQADAEAETLSG